MHQAIGSPPQPETLNTVVREEAMRLLEDGCRDGGALTGPFRVLDAGCGWGGTSFDLDKALDSFDHHIDGVTLSQVQHEQAKALANERGVDTIKFHLRSYDDVPIDKGETYDLAVSIEAIIHSRDVAGTFSAIGRSLSPSANNGCRASHLIVVEDVLIGGGLVNGHSNPAAVLDYKSHWAGWSFSEFPLDDSQWRSALTEHGGLDPNSVRVLDLGASYGLRLHSWWTLALAHAAVKTAYTVVKTLGVSSTLESYLSSYVGCYARERLLVAGALQYSMISATRAEAAPSFANKRLLQASPAPKPANQCKAGGSLIQPRQPLSNLSTIPGRHLHRADGCISPVLCCGQAPPSMNTGRGDSGSATTVPAGPGANEWKYFTGDYMRVFAVHMTTWFTEFGPSGFGTFLDIGGTGNTRAGMKQTAYKFAQVLTLMT